MGVNADAGRPATSAHGTYNELLSLGAATYLEVIGPDPDATGTRRSATIRHRQHSLVRHSSPGVYVRLRPLAEIIDEARAAGIELGDVRAMSRRRPDGVVLKWESTFPQLTGPFGPALPFMIDWGESPHPTGTLPAAARLVELEVVHPDTRAMHMAFEIIGVGPNVSLREGAQPALRATIATDAGEVTLTS